MLSVTNSYHHLYVSLPYRLSTQRLTYALQAYHVIYLLPATDPAINLLNNHYMDHQGQRPYLPLACADAIVVRVASSAWADWQAAPVWMRTLLASGHAQPTGPLSQPYPPPWPGHISQMGSEMY